MTTQKSGNQRDGTVAAAEQNGLPVADPWAASVDDVLETLDVGRREGLDDGRVARARERWGLNALAQEEQRGWFRRLLAQFSNLLIRILLVAAALTAFLQEWIETGVILAVVLVNAVIGFVQEGKAEEALRAIRDMLSPTARVLRNGKRTTIDAAELVPGDILLLDAGDKVPADVRIIESHGLHTQEAMLTGESVPVSKTAEPLPADTPLADRSAMAFSGTLVTSGQGRGVVVATGSRTELGRISGMLSEVIEIKTPLLRAMDKFARWLSIAIVILASVIFALGVLVRGTPVAEMFMTAVAIAVAAIPEGLPAILTVTLAIGVQRMARRHAIIRRLPAVETLGALTIICSDKTGTLTRNELVVRRIATTCGNRAITGTGYSAEGRLVPTRDLGASAGDDAPPEATDEDHAEDPADEPVRVALRAMVLCNDAEVRPATQDANEAGRAEDGREHDSADPAASGQAEEWTIEGDPLEAALLVAARRAGVDDHALRAEHARHGVVPFSSELKFMATLHDARALGADEEGLVVVVKGAPDTLIERSSHQREAEGAVDIDPPWWTGRLEEMTGSGQRVLGVAIRRLDHAPDDLAEAVTDLEMLGLFGFLDPPREEAISAVAEAKAAGVTVKMITGDHAGTARAIAEQLGIEGTDSALTGRDIDTLDDEDLARSVLDVDVYARTTPEHKLRLVRAMQSHRAVVAMTGDGVNDAPALKQADVGIAMGIKGTETAKEASEMVLADDNFASITRAIREGRTVYDNLRKAITFLLPVNGGESISILLAVLLGLALPITPVQVLWVNMVSSVALAMALAFEPAESNVMRRPPRRTDRPILDGFLIWRILFVSTLFAVGIFAAWFWSQAQGFSEEASRTMAVNTLVILEIFYLLSVRTLGSPIRSWRDLWATPLVRAAIVLVLVLQALFTWAPFMNTVFATEAVAFSQIIRIFGAGAIFLVLLEVEKAIRLRIVERQQALA
ncbi:MAG: HAD family hydrolase [Deltaproteobacteria bacterium]|nr:MAG: HAD family hydrolase [Deltaproteobacteria bacterium]